MSSSPNRDGSDGLVRRIEAAAAKLHRNRDLPWKFVSSLVDSWRNRETFRSVERFSFFIGYPRSGHSLVGQLINAHPDALISHELAVLQYVNAGFSKEQIYALIVQRDNWFADQDRQWTGYDYQIPGQWQGRLREPVVLGDKSGSASCLHLAANPGLLEAVRDRMDPIRVLHVTRNPYDNIASITQNGESTLEEAIEKYFRRARTIRETRADLRDEEYLHVRHEELVADTKTVLAEIRDHLGLAPAEDYLEDCASIVFSSPHKRREKLDWPEQRIEEIRERMDGFRFLDGYDFED